MTTLLPGPPPTFSTGKTGLAFEVAKRIAQQGTKPLMAHLNSLPEVQKTPLRPRWKELIQIADNADAKDPVQ